MGICSATDRKLLLLRIKIRVSSNILASLENEMKYMLAFHEVGKKMKSFISSQQYMQTLDAFSVGCQLWKTANYRTDRIKLKDWMTFNSSSKWVIKCPADVLGKKSTILMLIKGTKLERSTVSGLNKLRQFASILDVQNKKNTAKCQQSEWFDIRLNHVHSLN